MDIPRTGQAANVGVVVTKTLVIVGDQRVTNPGDRERGAMLRAYDKMTGENVGEVWMPAGQSGSPVQDASHAVDASEVLRRAHGLTCFVRDENHR